MRIEFPQAAEGMENYSRFVDFLQQQANRAANGHFRYGNPDRRKKYLKRLKRELQAYEETGNFEHLINIAVYCHLESCEPQHPNFHFDNSVESVTRAQM